MDIRGSVFLNPSSEKQIRHLCLTDFPCGNGSWKKTKDGADRAETEEMDTLLDLLTCTHSPWWHEESWSPQAPALRRLAVLTPDCLTTDFIYNYFTTLRIVNKDVSVIDDGLLKFSKLKELVLSVNKISEISAENLPSTLKVLELRANWLSSLSNLTNHPPPHLQYLGLGSNCLGSHQDVSHLTGSHWPHLVCLDLSDCEFQEQQTLLNALSTLPGLKTLVLEGNPFTLASSYPGVTVDSLPRVSYLDASWISPDERCRFRGLADMRNLMVDQASAVVSVGRMRGLPDPLSVDENYPDLPVVSYSYLITYEFLSHQTPVSLKVGSEPEVDKVTTAHVTGDSPSDADLQSNNCERQTSKPHTQDLVVETKETGHNIACVSRHSTPKLAWSENMDFADTKTYIVSDLGALKKFLSQGLYLCLEEEKVLSRPAASYPVKPSQNVKDMKGRKTKESPIKSGSTKGKSKDTKKKSIPALVQDAPIRRLLGSVHVPLQSLVRGTQKVEILCDLGVLQKHSQAEATQTLEKDMGKIIKDDKKEDDKGSKLPVGSGTGQKNRASLKGKVNEKDYEVDTDSSVSVQLEPVTVEFSVGLMKLQCASEAHYKPPTTQSLF
ncbi:hypothetical protein Q8A73_011813 [Channa argus]|nr:hypothetical protein Q8A73_011813 [Channa argus]